MVNRIFEILEFVGVSASPSVDITGISVGINFGWNQQDLYNIVKNYKSNGALQ